MSIGNSGIWIPVIHVHGVGAQGGGGQFFFRGGTGGGRTFFGGGGVKNFGQRGDRGGQDIF